MKKPDVIEAMLAFFFLFLAVFASLKRVILSETKNLITQTSAFQILHFVQNDTLFFIILQQNA